MLEHLGLVKTTLLDFPGLVSAVVFTPGCNLRCPWCHNPGMVLPPFSESLEKKDSVLEFLKKRRTVLQGVVVTGGEPLIHEGLPEFLEEVKALGYAIKLDTNGTLPERLAALRPGLVNYLAMDFKAPLSLYARAVGGDVESKPLVKSLEILKTEYAGRGEVRLTWVPGLHDDADWEEYALTVGPGTPVFVTGFRPGLTVDPVWGQHRAATPGEVEAVVNRLCSLGLDAQVR